MSMSRWIELEREEWTERGDGETICRSRYMDAITAEQAVQKIAAESPQAAIAACTTPEVLWALPVGQLRAMIEDLQAVLAERSGPREDPQPGDMASGPVVSWRVVSRDGDSVAVVAAFLSSRPVSVTLAAWSELTHHQRPAE